jgi:hypothetical protein
MVHLENELGPELARALFDPANIAKVREFVQMLVRDALPTTMAIGDRTYDILGFLRGGEESVVGHMMIERAQEMSAHLGEGDGQYLLDHQQYIPVALRGKATFVFTDWCHPDGSEYVCCVDWHDRRWARYWRWLGRDNWRGNDRVLRRRS